MVGVAGLGGVIHDKALCLEYCGLPHRGMISEIQVTEGGGQ